MMKYPTQFLSIFTLVVILIATAFIAPTAEARIGERRTAIESRLFGSGGIVYRDDAIEAARQKGMPYLRYMDYLPSSAEVRVYFKTDDGRRPTSSELDAKRISAGWDLHVVYVKGKSVVEVYKRSQAMSEYEFNQLLAIHAGGSFWKRVSKEERAEMQSAFGADMIRDDGRVHAKKIGGDSLMVVDAEFDVKLAEMNTSDLLEKAPVSVSGF